MRAPATHDEIKEPALDKPSTNLNFEHFSIEGCSLDEVS
jgi:hypothetical protein